MAIIPTIQRQQSLPSTTGVAPPPVVPGQDFGGKSLGKAFEQLGEISDDLYKAETASQVGNATTTAQIKLAALKKELDSGDAATAVGTYEARAKAIGEEAASGLNPKAAEEFVNKYRILSTAGQIHNSNTVTKKRYSELKGGLITNLDALAKSAAQDPNALVSAGDLINKALKTNVISGLEANKLLLKFKGKLDTAAATQLLFLDPHKLKKLLKDSKNLSNLDPVERAKFGERAEVRITKLNNAGKTAARKVERKFLSFASDYISAVRTGADVSPEFSARLSDENIRKIISDPDEAKVIIAKVRNAETDGRDIALITGASLKDQRAIQEKVNAEAEKEAKTPAEVAIVDDNKRHAARIRQAILTDQKLRKTDPVLYAINNEGVVKAAFDEFNVAFLNAGNGIENDDTGAGAGVQGAWRNYKDSLYAAYDRMQIPKQDRKILSDSYVTNSVDTIQTLFNDNPEASATQFQKLASVVGGDFNAIVHQMVGKGMDPKISMLAYNLNKPLVIKKLVSLVQGDTLKVLEEQIGPDLNKIDIDLRAELEGMFSVQGANNVRFTGPIQKAARALAVLDVAKNKTPVNKAVETAVNQVLHSDFQVVNRPKLKGLVPKSAGTYNVEKIVFGANQWMSKKFNTVKLDLSDGPNAFGSMTDTAKKQELAHSKIKNNGEWVFSPDGFDILLMDSITGLPVLREDKSPITLNARDLEQPLVNYTKPFTKKGGLLNYISPKR